MQRAVAAQRRREFALAKECYCEVLRRNPAHADATHFLGLLAHQTGHDDEALTLLQRAIELGPRSYSYRYNLACVYQALGRHADAERCSRETLALRPDHAKALFVLARSQAAQGRDTEALASYEQLLHLDPDYFDALLESGEVLLRLARRTEGLARLRKAHASATGDQDRLLRAGAAFRSAEAYADARTCFEEVLALSWKNSAAHVGLGVVCANLGDLHQAEAHYREALRLKPDNVSAYYNLVSQVYLQRDEPLWPGLMQLGENAAAQTADNRVLLEFALGKVWEDACEYTRAFPHFLAGNRLQRARLNYSESRQAGSYHAVMRSFDAGFFAAHADGGIPDASPIFIVGMSRSGTTLVEQILASHPAVYGGGEMQLLRQSVLVELGSSLSDDDLPQRLAGLDDALRNIAHRYLTACRELAPQAARIVDKSHGNAMLVGLIHVLFPKAHIIHCRRDPLDTCLSCFTRRFAAGHDFSYDLRELGRFYRLHEELMQHWTRMLPAGRMIELSYEDLVADPENQARRLIAFCGLEWDDACLHFYATSRPVRTASLGQVRRPIYRSSVGRWKLYAEFLAPLQAALSGAEPETTASLSLERDTRVARADNLRLPKDPA